METSNVNYIIPVLSMALSLMIIRPLSILAKKVSLVDKPSARKVHTSPIPLVGGLAIFISSGLVLLISNEFWNDITKYYVMIFGSAILLIMGVIDDKREIRSILKLIIQIGLAHFTFDYGIRIESLYGIFGIYELPVFVSYILSMFVIVGTVNAFNLMDGIDGLAAGLAVVGFSAFTFIAFLTENTFLVVLFLSLIGALIGFLRYNLSRKNKIFMGDAGSLVLGFIIVVSGIMMIQDAQGTPNITITLLIIIGVLILPVLDSLRVYRKRIKEGYSPFRADKTHFHHMVLHLGMKHKWASSLIIFTSSCIIILSIIFGTMFSVTIAILSILMLFVFISTFLGINSMLKIWSEKIKKLENFY